MNKPSQETSPSLHNYEFMRRIYTEAQKGYGFVPFIGSGFSAFSGIMIGKEFSAYFCHVIYTYFGKHPAYRELQVGIKKYAAENGLDDQGVFDNGSEEVYFSFFDNGWPGRPGQPALDKAKLWADCCYQYFAKKNNPRFRYPIRPPDAVAHKHEAASFHAEVTNFKMDGLFFPKAGKGLERNIKKNDFIFEAAIRSLHDWRSVLQFLEYLADPNEEKSEALKESEDDEEEPDLEEFFSVPYRWNNSAEEAFTAPDTGSVPDMASQPVTDSFNQFIVRGKSPNLGHYMLAHLSQPLGIRRIITTNFDQLIEKTYEQISTPLNTIPIQRNSNLPQLTTVLSGDALIKLHGDVHQTRADFSLDITPGKGDIKLFAKYIDPSQEKPYRHCPNRLLVMGSSLSDKRSQYYLRRILEFRDAKVYVIAFSTSQMDYIRGLFADAKGSVLFTITRRVDLFLFELYQYMTFTLPPGGFTHRFIQSVPAASQAGSGELRLDSSGITIASANLKALGLFPAIDTAQIRILYGRHSVTDFAERYFNLEPGGRDALWKELDDYQSPYQLMSELFQDISIRLGFYYQEHVVIDFKKAESLQGKVRNQFLCRNVASLVKCLGIDAKSWRVFIYGRGEPGAVGSWVKGAWRDRLYRLQVRVYKNLWECMAVLADAGFDVIYVPEGLGMDGAESDLSDPVLAETIDQFSVDTVETEKLVDECRKDAHFTSPVSAGDIEQDLGIHRLKRGLIAALLKDTGGFSKLKKYLDRKSHGKGVLNTYDENAIRYLYAAALLTQSRHISALLSEASSQSAWRYNLNLFLDSSDGHQNEYVLSRRYLEGWNELLSRSKNSLFRLKPGGYHWIRAKKRMLLQETLEGAFPLRFRSIPLEGARRELESGLRESRATTHFWLSEWYLRAFYATNHSDPLIESLYHRLAALRDIRYLCPTRIFMVDTDIRSDGQKANEAVINARLRLMVTSLSDMIKTLMVSNNSMRYWMYGLQAEHLFSWKALAEALDVEPDLIYIEHWVARTVGLELAALLTPARTGYVSYAYDLLIRLREESQFLFLSLRRESGEVLDPSDLMPRKAASTYFSNPLHDQIPTGGNLVDVNSNIDLDVAYRAWESILARLCDTGVDAFNRILSELIASLNRLDDPGKEAELVECFNKIREAKYQLAVEFQTQPKVYSRIVRYLSDLIYLYVRRANYLQNAESLRSSVEGTPAVIRPARLAWTCAGALARLVQDLCHGIDPRYLSLEHAINIKSLDLCGLSLAHLGKFNNAHEMFHRANAISFNLPTKESKHERAIIRLRMADAHLVEAAKLKADFLAEARDSSHKRDLYRKHISKLDDAATTLDAAEHLLIGNSHSSLWWGKLYQLRMKIFIVHHVCITAGCERGKADLELIRRAALPEGYDMLPICYRRRKDYLSYLAAMLSRGLLASRDDPFRKLVFIDIYAQCIRKFCMVFGLNRFTNAGGVLNSETLSRYAGRAIDQLKKILQDDLHSEQGNTGEVPKKDGVETTDWNAILPTLRDYPDINRASRDFRDNLGKRLTKHEHHTIEIRKRAGQDKADGGHAVLTYFVNELLNRCVDFESEEADVVD